MVCVSHWGGLISATKTISKMEQKNNRKKRGHSREVKIKKIIFYCSRLVFFTTKWCVFHSIILFEYKFVHWGTFGGAKKRSFHVRSQRFQIIWRCACGGNWKERQWIREFIAGGQFKNKKGLGDSKYYQVKSMRVSFVLGGDHSLHSIECQNNLWKAQKSMVKPVYQSRKFWIKVKNSLNFLEKEMATKWTGPTLFVRVCGCLQHYLLMGVWDQQYQ